MGSPKKERLVTLKAQSKQFIAKVVFLAARGRPLKRTKMAAFNGSVGICPFIKMDIAPTRAKNKEASTTLSKLVLIENNIWKNFMVENVFLAMQKAL